MKSIEIEQDNLKNTPKIGIFWLVPKNVIDEDFVLLYAAQKIEEASHVDVFYDATFEHYTLWNTVQKMFPELKNMPYEKYSRGRITLVAKKYPNDGIFKLMADIKILQQKECMEEIKRVFNLTDIQNVEILRDAHYRT